jgi:hypothetical protein
VVSVGGEWLALDALKATVSNNEDNVPGIRFTLWSLEGHRVVGPATGHPTAKVAVHENRKETIITVHQLFSASDHYLPGREQVRVSTTAPVNTGFSSRKGPTIVCM